VAAPAASDVDWTPETDKMPDKSMKATPNPWGGAESGGFEEVERT